MKEVKYIQKTGYNSFHGYKYATEADVNEKVREELAKQNVIMLPSMVGHEMRPHINRSGATEYITLVDMEFKFVDGDTGEAFTVNMSGEGQDAGDKGIYKAIAGAQKYALMKVFMIPTGDDPEADEGVDERNGKADKKPAKDQKPAQSTPKAAGKPTTKQPPQQQQQPQQGASADAISEPQRKKIYAMSNKLKLVDHMKQLMFERYSVTDSKALTKKQATDLIDFLTKMENGEATWSPSGDLHFTEDEIPFD